MPSTGGWPARGLKGTSVLFDAGSADFTSVLLQAMATGADTLLVNLPAGLAVPILKAAEEQDLRDQRRWIAPTPLYDLKIPAALGPYWAGKLHVHAELTRLDSDGPDARRWRAVTDRWGRSDAVATHRRDTFSQAGFVSADIFTHTLLRMDPRDLHRAGVTRALRAVRDWRTDLLCRPWYFGEGDRHLPNHAGLMLQYTGSGFRTVQDCFDAESDYLAPIKALERQQGIGRR
ncbi:ABC transporter substrate-binding protein [Aquincola sp. J276]|nr:ABC transporter substrate-binding protein [Aquincola sp. J276]MCR5868654.1 ABC transporter substrate-binding protein [Aquincola sp. J276]